MHAACPERLRETGVPGSACKLTDIPTGLTDGKAGLRMCGAIGIGSTASEIFLLEYAQGMREQDVAWGALNGANLEKLQSALTLHNTQFDLMERTPYIAARQGSMLLRAVLSALQGNAASGQLPDPCRRTTRRLSRSSVTIPIWRTWAR